MTRDSLERVTRLLRDATSDVGDVGGLPPRRDEAIARIEDAIRARARTRRKNTIIGSLAFAAGILAIGAGLAKLTGRSNDAGTNKIDLGQVHDSPGVVLVRDGRAESATSNERVAEGTELRTSTGSEAHLDFESGTRITIASETRVRLVEQRRKKRFALELGSIFARVAKLGPDERFVVATPDSEIEVRGTAFRVRLVPPDSTCGSGTPTRLEVVEGVVVVRHGGAEARVAAGESWPSCSRPGEPGEQPLSRPPRTSAIPPPPASAQTPRTRSSSASTSHLSEQNDLFDEAMREKRAGRSDASIAALARLLKSHPNGPLAEDASVELMRLLVASDRERATQSARDYLRRWPYGYARAEAESLAGVP